MTAAVKTLIMIVGFSYSHLFANEISRVKTEQYIEQYKLIVLNEANRSRIPASIKMAQAIIESGSGNSELASKYNNHFGIKCGSTWSGDKAFREDDDYNDGLLVKSCFRAYDDASLSFFDHTEFLINSQRYAFLFELSPTDYIGWAHGLSDAGYATDPTYPDKLIKVIEDFHLYNLDNESNVYVSNHEKTDKHRQIEVLADEIREDMEDIEDIARRVSILDELDKKYTLTKGKYLVKEGDNISDIAAHYHMDVRELYIKNRMPYGTQPVKGEQLIIKEYLQFEHPVKSQSDLIDSNSYLFEETIIIAGK
jgi:hypothetical protein